MNPGSYTLSKSSFLKYEQCHKAFVLHRTHPYLRDKPDVDKQLTFKRGHDVGYFAQQLFPGGKDVSLLASNASDAASITTRLLNEGEKVLYEATFIYDGVLVMADILVRQAAGYFAYEVKSSLKVSETYLKDAYLQFYVLKNSLPEFQDLYLVTLNPEFTKAGEIDPKLLFRKRSVKTQALQNFAYFEFRIRHAKELIEQNKIPDIAVGKHCFRPYQCDYFGLCWKGNEGENSIFNLPVMSRDKQFELFSQGVKTVDQLEDRHLDSANLRQLKSTFMNQQPIINTPAVNAFFSKLGTKVAALDMEIWSPAIPVIDGTRCFEQLPFLVSVFDGLNFSDCFVGYQGYERRQFAEGLLMLTADYDSILVYDRNLEVQVIGRLASKFPDLRAGLEQLVIKIADVFDIFLKLDYYSPRFGNSFSLKSVSSVLLPSVVYPKIGSGLEAMNYFERYRSAEGIDKEVLKAELIDYCNTDCLATFQLAELLKMA